MFYQVKVPEEHRSLMRFLWWPEEDLDKEVETFEMCVHLFGGVSSSSCTNYALLKTAQENEQKFGSEAAQTIKNNFYVDDMLKSKPTANEAIHLLQSLIEMCRAGGFRLTKILSNSKTVLESVPPSERSKSVTDLDLFSSNLPPERALGVHWDVENDTLGFRVQLKDKPFTRRGILSTISSIYDPLGLASPFMLDGKHIMQELCKANSDWDEPISAEFRSKWEKWRAELPCLEKIKVERCLKPKNFGKIKESCLYNYSDASEKGYGTVTYLRSVNEENKIHCALVLAKSRVTPLKVVSIPRLELTAATLAVRVGRCLKEELEIENLKEKYLTDSKVTLGYINNEARRFKTFVANRVQTIHDNTSVDMWSYVDTKNNPADLASRGINPAKVEKCKMWFHGPDYLWTPKEKWPKTENVVGVETHSFIHSFINFI